MIVNRPLVEAFERRLVQQTKPRYASNAALYEALYREAKALHVFPLKNPLEGIEVNCRLARAFNVQKAPR